MTQDTRTKADPRPQDGDASEAGKAPSGLKRWTRERAFDAALLRAIRTSAAVILATLLPTSAAHAEGFRECLDKFPGAPPVVERSDERVRQLCYDAFAVLHSAKTRTPIFVVQKLTRASLADADDETRTNRFFADARLPSAERAQLEDYRGSGFDRGHMAPAADMPTARAMAQSFSLANMVPQAPTNNRRIWAKVERDTRAYVRRTGSTVYVFTGPAWAGPSPTIGPNRVGVPTHLFKLVYDATRNRAWAHWVSNTDHARLGKPISYEALTQRLGFALLPGKTPAQ